MCVNVSELLWLLLVVVAAVVVIVVEIAAVVVVIATVSCKIKCILPLRFFNRYLSRSVLCSSSWGCGGVGNYWVARARAPNISALSAAPCAAHRVERSRFSQSANTHTLKRHFLTSFSDYLRSVFGFAWQRVKYEEHRVSPVKKTNTRSTLMESIQSARCSAEAGG